MADKQLVPQDQDALAALEECETKIKNAARRGLEATVAIGVQLEKIARLELFRAREEYTDFVNYSENHLGIMRRSAYRFMQVAEAVSLMKGRQLPLPDNEAQVIELAKLTNPDQQQQVWLRTRELCEQLERPVTADRIRLVIKAEAPPEPSGDGVQVDLESGFGAVAQAGVQAAAPAPPPKPLSLSEEGERALDRIGRLCGSAAQEAIEKIVVPISQRDLIKWADQDDQTVRNLAHYVLHERWTVNQAINYEARLITDATTVNDLVRLCLARGGLLSIIYDDGKSAKVQIALETLVA